jgi:hypothetical protein
VCPEAVADSFDLAVLDRVDVEGPPGDTEVLKLAHLIGIGLVRRALIEIGFFGDRQVDVGFGPSATTPRTSASGAAVRSFHVLIRAASPAAARFWSGHGELTSSSACGD